MDSAADLPKIRQALLQRGYTAQDCDKIMGGNLLRVFHQVELIGKQLQAQNRPRIAEKQPFEKSTK
jgi:membrane dipeptidase